MSSLDFHAIYSRRNRAGLAIYPLDVFALTDLGTAQIHGGPTDFPADVLEIMVLLDAKATVGDIEQKAAHIPSKRVRDLLRTLVSAGLVRAATVAETDGLDFDKYFGTTRRNPALSLGTQASADREAKRGTPRLARAGFYVSIARRAVKAKSPSAGGRWSALLVEDDPDVSALVSRSLTSEGFDVKVAASREQIVAQLRKTPLPDVAILDVNLPDANGFDILQRMKTHSVLKAIPVVMLTADTKRESVVRGLAAGADGYITKPFETAALLDGVRAVLGIGPK